MSKVKIGVSACLVGKKCNYNGEDIKSQFISGLQKKPSIEFVLYCPEEAIFGSPRPNLRIVGGDGEDVLIGAAKVINENEEDVTEQQIEGAQKFLKKLVAANVKYAILTEGSPSCGSSIILAETNWPSGGFKRGVGVAAALLKREGIKVLGSFNEKEIGEFLNDLVEDYNVPSGLVNLADFPKFEPLFAE